MFTGAASFNQDLSVWDVSSSTNFDRMFNKASSFNHTSICAWDIMEGAGLSNTTHESGIDYGLL